MDLELMGKVAVVTGGSRGIGKATALVLAAEGADVALVARDRTVLDGAVEEVRRAGGRRAIGVVADTRDDAAVRAMAARVVEELGRIDVLVNCAARVGGQVAAPTLEQITDEEVLTELDTKVLGYLRCARAVTPHMIRQGWGRIMNVSGLAARQSGSVAGSMRNVALVALTKNLADELGPSGINVTCVHPGGTRTERTAGTDLNAIRRVVEARDVAQVIAFLCSPKSVAISGDVIAAGGGAGNRAIYY